MFCVFFCVLYSIKANICRFAPITLKQTKEYFLNFIISMMSFKTTGYWSQTAQNVTCSK